MCTRVRLLSKIPNGYLRKLTVIPQMPQFDISSIIQMIDDYKIFGTEDYIIVRYNGFIIKFLPFMRSSMKKQVDYEYRIGSIINSIGSPIFIRTIGLIP